MPNKQSNSILLMKEALNLMLPAECRYCFFIKYSSFASSEVKGVKELSLPTVAEELRQQSFWRIF